MSQSTGYSSSLWSPTVIAWIGVVGYCLDYMILAVIGSAAKSKISMNTQAVLIVLGAIWILVVLGLIVKRRMFSMDVWKAALPLVFLGLLWMNLLIHYKAAKQDIERVREWHRAQMHDSRRS